MKKHITVMHGYLFFKPVMSLKKTARMLGQALGNVVFEETDHFDEFSAYIGYHDGFQFSLLGIPDPRYNVAEKMQNKYDLDIRGERAGSVKGEVVDISDEWREFFIKKGLGDYLLPS